MKVALVSSGTGSRGGGEIYLCFLAQGLAAAGHEVTALVPDGPHMDDLAAALTASATVTRFAYRPTYQRRSRTLGAVVDRGHQRKLARIFRALRADVIHLNQQVAEDGLDLLIAAHQSGKPWVSTVHVGYAAAHLGARFGALRDWLTRGVFDRVQGHYIAVSAASHGQLAARFATQSGRITTVLNGVPPPDTDALAAARKMARADWAVAPDAVVVGTVGRIEAQKAPLAFIDHLAPMIAAHPNVQLVWIGDGALKEALQDHAQAAGVPLHIDGWRADAAVRLAGLDVFVLPSLFEGLPLALLEAMHAGLPCIASHADGIAEAITSGETGYLCANDADWTAALSDVLENAETRRAMGAKAQQRAQSTFSVAAMAAATVAVYTQTIADKGAA